MFNQEFTEQFKELLKPLVKEVLQEQRTGGNIDETLNPLQKLSINAAAKEFGFDQGILRSAMNSGDLPYYAPEKSQRVYLQRNEVAKYIDSIRIKTNAEVQDYSFLKPKRK